MRKLGAETHASEKRCSLTNEKKRGGKIGGENGEEISALYHRCLKVLIEQKIVRLPLPFLVESHTKQKWYLVVIALPLIKFVL